MLAFVHVDRLAVSDALVLTPSIHADERGAFLEWFRADDLAAAGLAPFTLAQANLSQSRAGVVRGIHYADVPPGQAKYVTCPAGAILDVIVDLRVGSPTFGRWDAVRLDAVDRRCVFIPEGFGHGFCALEDSTVAYLCSTSYNPTAEHGVDPFDADLAITWPDGAPHLTSPKDAAAPSLAQALADGALPSYAECVAWYGRTVGAS